MKKSQQLLSEWYSVGGHSVAEHNAFMHSFLAAIRKEKIEDEELFAVRALAFALLECRSEKEALQVIRYFTRSKSSVSASPKPSSQSDEFGENNG